MLWESTSTSEEIQEAQQGYDDTGAVPYVLRSPEQISRCFEGLELLEPGLVSISLWRPDTADAVAVDGYGAVGRRP